MNRAQQNNPLAALFIFFSPVIVVGAIFGGNGTVVAILMAVYLAGWAIYGIAKLVNAPQSSSGRLTNWTIADMLRLSPTQFEHYVADLFRACGYRLRGVGGSGDNLADIVGTDPQGVRIVIQCKRYAPANTVGARDVHNLVGMAVSHHKAPRMIFVTTSSYTRQALDLGRTTAGLELYDGNGLRRLAGQVAQAQERARKPKVRAATQPPPKTPPLRQTEASPKPGPPPTTAGQVGVEDASRIVLCWHCGQKNRVRDAQTKVCGRCKVHLT